MVRTILTCRCGWKESCAAALTGKKILASETDPFCDTLGKRHHDGKSGALQCELGKATVDIDDPGDGDIACRFKRLVDAGTRGETAVRDSDISLVFFCSQRCVDGNEETVGMISIDRAKCLGKIKRMDRML